MKRVQLSSPFFAPLLLFFLLLAACSMKKATRIEVVNKNPYAIDFTVKANNIRHTVQELKPGESRQEMMDWTAIEKVDGQWILLVRNLQSGGVDSFAHGFFTKGELSNFLDAESMGSQLKVKVSE